MARLFGVVACASGVVFGLALRHDAEVWIQALALGCGVANAVLWGICEQ